MGSPSTLESRIKLSVKGQVFLTGPRITSNLMGNVKLSRVLLLLCPPTPTALCEYVNKVNYFVTLGSLHISIVWQRYQVHSRLPQANNAKLSIV